jgi:hypothetical protein
MRWAQTLVGITALVLSQWLAAGGSAESVVVKSLRVTDDVDYELVVIPVKRSAADDYKDPYMGACSTFTVRGTYAWLYSALRLPAHVTKAAHVEALSHLSKALESGRTVNLGWMGTGFVAVNPATPCIVRSRALQLLIDRGQTYVVSYHDAV